MKITEQTKKLLENYATINNGILIQATKENTPTTLQTCDSHKMVMAQTVISEKFGFDVCLYDLKQFLSVLSSLKDPEIEFNDNNVVIKDLDSSTIKLSYADPMTVSHLTKTVTLPAPAVSFDLKQESLTKLLNFSNILGLVDLKLYSKEGKLFFQAFDKKGATKNTFEVEVGVGGNAGDEFYFQRDLLKMIPGDYRVELSSKAAKFVSMAHANLEYIVALAIK